MPTLPVVAPDADAIAAALQAYGACYMPALPDVALAAALRTELLRLRDENALDAASVGRADSHALRREIRGDATIWLDDPRCGEAASAYLAVLNTLRVELNHRLFLGLEEVEAHYAAYPPSTGYRRHRDRFHDDDARVLSIVTYLNPDWREDDDGALRLHRDDGVIDIVPRSGSVCFLSEHEHEVLPARRERFSIAAWFRRR